MKTACLLVLASLMFTPAYAAPASNPVLTTGVCSPAAQVRAALTEQKQSAILVGNRSGYGYATSLAFTSDPDGKTGYLIRGDKPFGEQATTICIDSVYRDIRLNDIGKPGLPSWALMGDDPVKAAEVCKRENLGYQAQCSSNDRYIRNLDQSASRVTLLAIGTAINPIDKTIRTNQRVVLTLDPVTQIGAVMGVMPEGANYLLAAYTKGAFTPQGSALLGKGR